MPFEIVRNDIVKMSVDVIVNAANTALKKGGGVCGAIFSAAGTEKLQAECDRIGKCEVGQAVMTKGYDLPAGHIIHTVGPVWQGGKNNEPQLLSDCYTNSLLLAQQNDLKSIAFPLISSGTFGYPKDQALEIAVSAIGEFLLKNEMMVYLVVYDDKSFVLGEKLFASITEYIDSHYVNEHPYGRTSGRVIAEENIAFRGAKYSLPDTPSVFTQGSARPSASKALDQTRSKRKLEDVLSQLDETFSQMLLRLIDEKGKTDVETYKRANISHKLFSKIRSNKNYNPSKNTAIAFAIALELNKDETRDFLGRAGYALSHSSKFDVIIQFFIEEGKYNIFEINEALFAFDQPLLGV